MGGFLANGGEEDVMAAHGRATAGHPTQEPLLRGNKLAKSFGASRALRGASIDIFRGETVAIVGPSGSGKSTLLLCLAGIIDPDSGFVEFQGQAMSSMADDQRSRLRRESFGFVFQFGQLVPELTGTENVSLPLRLAGVPNSAARMKAITTLDAFGVRHVAEKLPSQMSGGETQRVALGRAVINQPDILFADEPTGSLDSANARAVIALLAGLSREWGTTLVLVTHSRRVAASAERVVAIRDGIEAL
jgi:putative ABC transport system ATP-binding protein